MRMALGASRAATTMLVLSETGRMAAIGLAIGLVLAVIGARAEAAVLFDQPA
jgi:predicted lysophospholipase L1 biosynthesis ABC-type transport system permease subunit